MSFIFESRNILPRPEFYSLSPELVNHAISGVILLCELSQVSKAEFFPRVSKVQFKRRIFWNLDFSIKGDTFSCCPMDMYSGNLGDSIRQGFSSLALLGLDEPLLGRGLSYTWLYVWQHSGIPEPSH